MSFSPFVFVLILILTGIIQFVFAITGFFGIFALIILFVVVLPLLIINAALAATLHYFSWRDLPEGFRELEPSRTALMLLIPFFNLYWVFITFPKLGKGFDLCLASNKLDPGMKKENLGLFYACAIVAETCFAWVPVVSALTSVTVFIAFLLFYIEVMRSLEKISKVEGQLVSYPAARTTHALSTDGEERNSMQRLLRLAKEHDGKLSLAQISMNMDLAVEDINQLLNDAQKYGYAEIVNHPETGSIRYHFDID